MPFTENTRGCLNHRAPVSHPVPLSTFSYPRRARFQHTQPSSSKRAGLRLESQKTGGSENLVTENLVRVLRPGLAWGSVRPQRIDTGIARVRRRGPGVRPRARVRARRRRTPALALSTQQGCACACVLTRRYYGPATGGVLVASCMNERGPSWTRARARRRGAAAHLPVVPAFFKKKGS
jgi:hypothetical protein